MPIDTSAGAPKSEEPGTVAAKTPAKEDKVTPEESSWRERLSKARDKAKSLERDADQAELRVTELRNNLGTSGQSAKYRNEVAAGLEETGQRVAELRKQARAAAEEVTALEEYGREKKYTEDQGPAAKTSEGNPNEQYYRARFEKLTEAIRDADRRVQVYENRIRDLSQHILLNGGKNGGDNFYIAQLTQDRDEAQQKLNEATAARSKAQADLDALLEDGRRAGVAPGVFR